MDWKCTGGRVTHKPNGVNCAQALRHIWSLGGEAAVQDTVSFLRSAFPEDKRVFTCYYIRATHALLAEIPKTKHLKKDRLVKVMAAVSYPDFHLEVIRAIQNSGGTIAEQEAVQRAMKLPL
jgi:hypothetical protein